MRRREFITAVGGAAVTWPLAARAQQPAKPLIGFLGSELADLWADRLRELRQGLSDLSFVEGQNLAIDYRWAEGRNERLPAMASELAAQQVKAIIAPGSTPAALAAQAATKTIPIVFEIASDPVEFGLVASLNHPGGNITGITTLNSEIGTKRLELLHSLVPASTFLGLLINPTNARLAEANVKSLQAAAQKMGVELRVLNASTADDFDARFTELKQTKAEGTPDIGGSAFQQSHAPARDAIAALCDTDGLPVSRIRRGRRSAQLWNEFHRNFSYRRQLYRPHS